MVEVESEVVPQAGDLRHQLQGPNITSAHTADVSTNGAEKPHPSTCPGTIRIQPDRRGRTSRRLSVPGPGSQADCESRGPSRPEERV